MVIPQFISNLTSAKLDQLQRSIQAVYIENKMPWIIGFSGGKDSTATLQLVWNAIAALPAENRTNDVYVLSSDTLVETPIMVDYIDTTLENINEAASLQNMPIEAHKVVPQLKDTFWVNLIGKGYPAPYNRFRWCTDRLKIKPVNAFIQEKVSKYGEAIVVLGLRKQESSTRAQAMSLHKIENNILRRHSTLPNAFVYAPIEDFSVQDVWSYLLNVKSPWGNDNRDLIAIYQDAQAGECPLVVDTTTPTCGSSRFGCWVCTVVEKDHSMEALIDNGEEWLEPLLNLRDFLSSTQESENKIKYRSHKRIGGKVSFKPDGDIARGPYKLDFCRQILRKLLEAEEEVNTRANGDPLTLISEDELHEIRRLWRNERQDWDDTVPKIAQEVSSKHITWLMDDAPQFNLEDRNLLDDICLGTDVPPDLVAKLVDVEISYSGIARRSGIFEKLEKVIAEEWRTEQEITDNVHLDE